VEEFEAEYVPLPPGDGEGQLVDRQLIEDLAEGLL